MSTDDSDNSKLNRVIAEYLRAVEEGTPQDREALVDQHPDLADDLQSFFANHDQMNQAAQSDSEDATLPPSNPCTDTATIPPRSSATEEATIPPGGEASATVGTRVRYFGDYELLEEIARGGMGVVYKARQVTLNRIVALKMILAGQLAGEEDVQRFHAEAEAAANLDHPGIVPIFEIGEHDGQHYFSMGFVDGMSLADRIQDGPLPPEEAAEYTKKVAEAVAFAHERGVIHRDLKPANVLLDTNGEPKVTDFGLAKKVEDDSGLTATGQILGTPSYMPPEQAAGKIEQVTESADVYSLGAILYALVTGRPPFQAASHLDTLLQVIDQEPVSPRVLNAKIPQDLETICLKCLQKDQHHRYASSQDLVAELQRYLAGEPILARPISAPARGWRWCKRNPVVASLTAAVSFALILGTTVATYFAILANNRAEVAISERDRADANAEKFRLEKERADAKTAEALTETQRADKKAAEALIQKNRAAEKALEAQQQRDRARRRLYQNQIFAAQREWQTHDAAAAWNQLNATRWNLRGWEYEYLFSQFSQGLLTGHQQTILGISFSLDGSKFYSCDERGTLRVWDAISLKEIATLELAELKPRSKLRNVAFNRDSSRVAAEMWKVGETETPVWDTGTGRQIWSVDTKQLSLASLAFSPDGSKIVGAGEFVLGRPVITMWDATSGKQVLTLDPDRFSVKSLFFSPDGSIVAGAGYEAQSGKSRSAIRLWNAATGEQVLAISSAKIGSVEEHDSLQNIAFSPDGSRILGAWRWSGVRIFDAETGEQKLRLEGGGAAVFSADGSRIASGSIRPNNTVVVRDAESGVELQRFAAHPGEVRKLAFSPDGKRIVSSPYGSDLKVYELGDHSVALQTEPESVTKNLRISENGAWVAGSGGAHGTDISIWHAETGEQKITLRGHVNPVRVLALSVDGSRIASAGEYEKSVKLWDIRNRKTFNLTGHTRPITNVAFGPKNRLIATSSSDRKVKVWDTTNGQEIITLSEQFAAQDLAFSPDDSQVVGVSRRDGRATRNTVKVWDAISGEEKRSFDGKFNSVAYNPDGTRIVATGATGKVWDTATGAVHAALDGESPSIGSVSFSPDGSRIVGSSATTIRLWDAETGVETLALKGPARVRFSPDGQALVGTFVAASRPMVKTWAAPLRDTSVRHIELEGPVLGLCFSPDSEQIICAGPDNRIHVWDSNSGDEVSSVDMPQLGIRTPALAFSQDLTRIVKGSRDGVIEILDIPTEERPPLILEGHKKAVVAVAFSPDGSRVVSCAADETIIVWNVQNGKAALTIDGIKQFVSSVAFSPDGSRIVTGLADPRLGGRPEIKVWDAETGVEVQKLEGPSGFIQCVSFSPDGLRIASGSVDKTVRLWDVATGQAIRTYDGHSTEVTSLAFSQDGSRIVTGGFGLGTAEVKVWDLATGEELKTVTGDGGFFRTRVAFSGDGTRVVANVSKNSLAVMQLNIAMPSNPRKSGFLDRLEPKQVWIDEPDAASVELAHRARSQDNMRRISVGLRQFQQKHGVFPAAYNTDEGGQPLLSWRVHLLPFLDETELYNEFHLDEPWDSEHNRRLIEKIPVFFRSPASQAAAGKTNYLAIGGTFGCFPPPSEKAPTWDKVGILAGLSFSRFLDGTSNTIGIVEASDDLAVEWTKAVDFNPFHSNVIRRIPGMYPETKTFQVLRMDGAVQPLQDDFPPAFLAGCFDPVDGILLFNLLGRSKKGAATAHFGFGRRLRANGDLPGAIASFREAIRSRPEDATFHFSLGATLRANEQLEEAIAAYQKAIELKPDTFVYHNALGLALRAHGKLDEAILAYQEALELKPDSHICQRNLGVALQHAGRFPEALEAYRKSVELKPDYAPAYNSQAWLLCTCSDSALQDSEQAIKLAEKAVELSAESGPYWSTLGLAHYRQSMWEQATEALGRSRELQGDNGRVLFVLAMSHWQLKNTGEARSWYTKAIEWVEQNQPTDKDLSRLRAEAEQLLGD